MTWAAKNTNAALVNVSLKNLQSVSAKLGFSLAEMPQVAVLAGSF